VWLVELAPLADPPLSADRSECAGSQRNAWRDDYRTLTTALKEKQMLLILDNGEHLLDACALLADTLLAPVPE